MIVGQDMDLIVFRGIEFDDGATAKAEHLMNRHRGRTKNDRNVDRDVIEFRQGAPVYMCWRWFPAAKWFHHGYGYEVVNTRDSLKIGLLPPAGSPPIEWQVSDSLVDYESALAAMTARAAAIARGEAAELIWLLQHPPLYTAGTSARPQDLVAARFPVHNVGRGGQFTYHGPGQRVGYVMLDLKRRAPDVRRFVATLEEWIIQTLAAFNVRGERRGDRVGVWVKRPEKGSGFEDKIAAIGIRVRQWVTLHGFALNVEPDLSHFSGIVPCGVNEPRYGVASLADLGLTVTMPEVDMTLRSTLAPLFGASADAQSVLSTENSSSRPRAAKSAASASS
jgi:lipoyl(octanoyl) transferase